VKVENLLRIREGCFFVDASAFKNLKSYAELLFKVSRDNHVYIIEEPSSIVALWRGIKRRIAVAPGDAVVCPKSGADIDGVRIEEDVWIDASMLIPHSNNKDCVIDGFPIYVSNEVFIPHLAVDDRTANSVELLLSGGLACFSRGTSVISGIVSPKLVYGRILMLYNKLLKNLRDVEVSLAIGDISMFESRYSAYIEPALLIDTVPVLYYFGKGFILNVAIEQQRSDTVEELFSFAYMVSHSVEPDSHLARIYRALLNGRTATYVD